MFLSFQCFGGYSYRSNRTEPTICLQTEGERGDLVFEVREASGDEAIEPLRRAPRLVNVVHIWDLH